MKLGDESLKNEKKNRQINGNLTSGMQFNFAECLLQSHLLSRYFYHKSVRVNFFNLHTAHGFLIISWRMKNSFSLKNNPSNQLTKVTKVKRYFHKIYAKRMWQFSNCVHKGLHKYVKITRNILSIKSSVKPQMYTDVQLQNSQIFVKIKCTNFQPFPFVPAFDRTVYIWGHCVDSNHNH